ncbi:MAG TPA: NAD(P)-dependent oxidoreductase [Candidatus Marinimicrobia bacterium]|nr:NAD(P)-dependent oxidoreductase [Candidatus Neomarinimicrobiota bacterium]
MKILVTGATGFIGRHLVPQLLEEHYDVRCLARQTSLKPDSFKDHVGWVLADLNDPASLAAVCDEIDLVIHLAGLTKATNAAEFFKTNVTGTENLLHVLTPDKKIILISSQAAIGPSATLQPLPETALPNPISAYGRSKLLAENHLIRAGQTINYTIIRPPIVYGPEDRESLAIFRLAKYRLNPIIGFRKAYVNLVYVADLIEFILLCLKNRRSDGEIFHINDGNDSGYTQNELVKKAAEKLETHPVPLYIPKFLLKTVAEFNTFISRLRGNSSMLNRDKYTELTARGWLLSSQKARTILNYQPRYDIDRGFELTVNWYRQKGWL